MEVELGEKLLFDGGQVGVVRLLAEHAVVVVGLLHFLPEGGALPQLFGEFGVAHHRYQLLL